MCTVQTVQHCTVPKLGYITTESLTGEEKKKRKKESRSKRHHAAELPEYDGRRRQHSCRDGTIHRFSTQTIVITEQQTRQRERERGSDDKFHQLTPSNYGHRPGASAPCHLWRSCNTITMPHTYITHRDTLLFTLTAKFTS